MMPFGKQHAIYSVAIAAIHNKNEDVEKFLLSTSYRWWPVKTYLTQMSKQVKKISSVK